MSDTHRDDLTIVREGLETQVSKGRMHQTSEPGPLIILSASETEVRRLEGEARRLVSDRDLFVLVSVERWNENDGRWEQDEAPLEQVSPEDEVGELAWDLSDAATDKDDVSAYVVVQAGEEGPGLVWSLQQYGVPARLIDGEVWVPTFDLDAGERLAEELLRVYSPAAARVVPRLGEELPPDLGSPD